MCLHVLANFCSHFKAFTDILCHNLSKANFNTVVLHRTQSYKWNSTNAVTMCHNWRYFQKMTVNAGK